MYIKNKQQCLISSLADDVYQKDYKKCKWLYGHFFSYPGLHNI